MRFNSYWHRPGHGSLCDLLNEMQSYNLSDYLTWFYDGQLLSSYSLYSLQGTKETTGVLVKVKSAGGCLLLDHSYDFTCSRICFCIKYSIVSSNVKTFRKHSGEKCLCDVNSHLTMGRSPETLLASLETHQQFHSRKHLQNPKFCF